MSDDGNAEDWIKGIQRLSIPDDDKAFLIAVRRQFEAECAKAAADDVKSDADQ